MSHYCSSLPQRVLASQYLCLSQKIKDLLSLPSLIWPFWYLFGVEGVKWQGSPRKWSLTDLISKIFWRRFVSSGAFSDFIFPYSFWFISIIENLENAENRGTYKEETIHDSATQKQPLLLICWHISYLSFSLMHFSFYGSNHIMYTTIYPTLKLFCPLFKIICISGSKSNSIEEFRMKCNGLLPLLFLPTMPCLRGTFFFFW